MPEFVALIADAFLRALFHIVIGRQTEKTEKLVEAVRIIVAELFASETLDLVIEIAKIVSLFIIFMRRFLVLLVLNILLFHLFNFGNEIAILCFSDSI